MASNLYNEMMGNRNNYIPGNNKNVSLLGQLGAFAKTLNGANPKTIIENMLKSGQMTQEQFNELSNQANAILGKG